MKRVASGILPMVAVDRALRSVSRLITSSCEAELCWLMTREWAHTAEDVLWRRTKLGLGATPAQVHELTKYLAQTLADPASAPRQRSRV